MDTKTKIYEQLRTVNDPELNVNVVDLGLIYHVDFTDAGVVSIQMTLTTPGCPLHDSIVGGVRHAVTKVEGIADVQVDVVWTPAWSPEMMTEEGRRLLEG